MGKEKNPRRVADNEAMANAADAAHHARRNSTLSPV